jgi:uncharacterized protein YjbI with pentapeptide repeats
VPWLWRVGLTGTILGTGFGALGQSLDDRPWLAIAIGAAGGATIALVAAWFAKRHVAPAPAPVRRPTLIGFALAALLIGGGLALWAPKAGGQANANTDLGTALIGGAVVAFAVLILQQRLDARAQAIEARRLKHEDAERLRQQAQLLCALSDDLTGVDFNHRDLRDMYLRGKVLQSANLEGADLRSATLTGADLREADLRRADLRRAHAAGAKLQGAALVKAKLEKAVLEGADLRECNLEGAVLDGADLRGASFEDAMNLTKASLQGATYTTATKWPTGFKAEAAGAVVVKDQALPVIPDAIS